jgi:hypothetical protein
MKFAVDSRPVNFRISQPLDCSDGILSTRRGQGIHGLSHALRPFRVDSSRGLLLWWIQTQARLEP